MVRRIFAMLAAAALLAIPVSTASADEQLCSSGDAQAFVNFGPIGAVHALSGRETGPADSWSRCQFRLYEPTHTFSTREWIVGGVFMFESYDTLDRPEYDRQAATQFLDQIKVRVWLGPKGGTLAPRIADENRLQGRETPRRVWRPRRVHPHLRPPQSGGTLAGRVPSAL